MMCYYLNFQFQGERVNVSNKVQQVSQIVPVNALLLVAHVCSYSGQLDCFRPPPSKYSCPRYFRIVDRLFSIGVCGRTPEQLLASSVSAFLILVQERSVCG